MSGWDTAGGSRHMGCDELREVAAELALGSLDDAERADAQGHLDGCADCQTEVERLVENTGELLLLAPETAPPAGFEERVLDRLGRADDAVPAPPVRANASPVTSPIRPEQRPVRSRRVLAAAAASILLVGIVVTALTLLSRDGGSALAAAEMRTDGGDVVGEAVLQDAGSPVVYLDLPDWKAGWERHGLDADTRWLLAVDTGAGQRNVYPLKLDDWSAEVSLGDVDPGDLVTVSVIDEDGRVWCSGSFA